MSECIMIVISPESLHNMIKSAIEEGNSITDTSIANGLADTLIHDAIDSGDIKQIFFMKEYDGFESTVDIGRDVDECFDERFNENAGIIPTGEWTGKMTLVMTYENES